jgi:hypothetical protein
MKWMILNLELTKNEVLVLKSHCYYQNAINSYLGSFRSLGISSILKSIRFAKFIRIHHIILTTKLIIGIKIIKFLDQRY